MTNGLIRTVADVTLDIQVMLCLDWLVCQQDLAGLLRKSES